MVYALTNTGVKGDFPGIDQCEHPSVEIPGISGVYRAAQFHIHTSSEHTIDGEFFGAELHTVHKEVDGDRFAVVGMMIQPSAAEKNKLFQELLDGWAVVMQFNEDECAVAARGGDRTLGVVETTAERRLASNFSPYMLIPEGATFYHYDGGLTTPPCSEVVWWNLADKSVSITPAQYSQLKEQVLDYTDIANCEHGTSAGPAGSTSRPTQPLNGRYAERICPEDFVMEATASDAASVSVLGAAALAGAALLLF
jgi:carbonic anhydrase